MFSYDPDSTNWPKSVLIACGMLAFAVVYSVVVNDGFTGLPITSLTLCFAAALGFGLLAHYFFVSRDAKKIRRICISAFFVWMSAGAIALIGLQTLTPLGIETIFKTLFCFFIIGGYAAASETINLKERKMQNGLVDSDVGNLPRFYYLGAVISTGFILIWQFELISKIMKYPLGETLFLAGQILAALSLIGLGVYHLNRRLTGLGDRAMGNILNGLDKIRRGDYNARIPSFGDEQLGAIAMALNETTQALSEAEEERKMLELRSMRDPLTMLFNRWYLSKRAMEITEEARFRKRDIAALFLDIDHFKQINDNYGHPVGDVVLETIATRCIEAVRAGDICIRYGGEEILILLLGSPLKFAVQKAESIRAACEEPILVDSEQIIQASVSIGVAGHISGDDLWLTINRADEALYEAKLTGRNKVVCHEEHMADSKTKAEAGAPVESPSKRQRN